MEISSGGAFKNACRKKKEPEGSGPEEGRAERARFFNCFAQGDEIFLIFRLTNSNLVTRMSPKARNEPGWRIADGCARYILFYRNI